MRLLFHLLTHLAVDLREQPFPDPDEGNHVPGLDTLVAEVLVERLWTVEMINESYITSTPHTSQRHPPPYLVEPLPDAPRQLGVGLEGLEDPVRGHVAVVDGAWCV